MKRKIMIPVLILSVLAFSGCSGGSGSSGPAEVSMSEVQIVQAPAAEGIKNIEFGFSDSEGSEFTCLAAGFKSEGPVDTQAVSDMAEKAAGYFAAGAKSQITGIEGFQPIDAEKYSGKDNASRSDGKPFGDANLCWAASAADMLYYSGWTDMDEDAVLTEFTENYFDDGSFQDTGIKFFFNGINPDQVCSEKAGSDGCRNAVFSANEESSDLFSSTQVRNPGMSGGKTVNNGHLNGYSAEKLCTQLNASDYSRTDMEHRIINALDAGDSVGIDVVFYSGDSRVGVHAMTAFGYIKDSEGEMKALIISDSDNDIKLKQQYPESADETFSDRASRPDTYDVYLTECFEHNGQEFIKLKDYKFSNSKLKYDSCVVQAAVFLISNGKSAEAAAEPEGAGTMDSANTPDLVPSSAASSGEDTDFTVSPGEEVSMPFILSDISYRGYDPADKPYAVCRYDIYDETDQKTGSESFDVQFVTDSYTTGEAMCSFLVRNPYRFENPGCYRMDVAVEGVYSGIDGRLLDEAYTVNNLLTSAGTVTVK